MDAGSISSLDDSDAGVQLAQLQRGPNRPSLEDQGIFSDEDFHIHSAREVSLNVSGLREESRIRVEAQILPRADTEKKLTVNTCPECYDHGKLCTCCCDDGLFGYEKCCGHKVGKCEPKWVLKLIMVFTELSWALSLQNDLDQFDHPEFIENYIRPMAWCAWNAMMIHIVVQFSNRMCLNNNAVVNSVTLVIDLVFDDFVQLTALSLFWYKEGFENGDVASAMLTGCLAIVLASHNLFGLCAGCEKRLCWGLGHTMEGYKGVDHEAEAWCPYCTCPQLSKSCGWCCNYCCPTEKYEFCNGCVTTCYQPVYDKSEKHMSQECNIVCYQCNILAGGKNRPSCCRMTCHLLSNTWLMALWAVHVGGIVVFLYKYHDCSVNPYPCNETVGLAIVALAIGVVTLVIAYVLECVRAWWLASVGVRGKLAEDKRVGDFVPTTCHFQFLSHVLLGVLVLNLVGSVGPWCNVLWIMIREEWAADPNATPWLPMLVGAQVIFFALVSIWEVCIREIPVFNQYRDEREVDLIESVGHGIMSRHVQDMVIPIPHDVELTPDPREFVEDGDSPTMPSVADADMDMINRVMAELSDDDDLRSPHIE